SSGDRDNYILAGDQVFVGDVAGCSNNLSAAFIAILFDDFLQLIMHDRTLTLGPRQDVFVIGDLELDLCQLINNLLALQSGQTTQLHGQDSVRLDCVNVQQRHQTFTGFIHGRATADQCDDLIEHVQRLNQTKQDVRALFGFIQAVLGASNNDLGLVGELVAQHLIDTQGAWHAINDGEHVRTKRGLQLRVLVEVVEHHARYCITLERDDNAHADAVRRFVFNLGDASNLAVGHGLRDIGDQVIWVDLVRQLRNNNGLA